MVETPLITTAELKYIEKLIYPDIAIAQNDTTFIVGESGSGKSTLLKLINGSISADCGHVFYQGDDLCGADPVALRREVVLCGQSVYLFDKTIEENFDEYYKYREEVPPNSETKLKYLKICGLDFPLDTSCVSMSGGERQRVFIAICLSFEPKVLMLDEPTAALDAGNAKLLISNIKAYCKANAITLIVISHDRSLSEEYADATIDLGDIGDREFKQREPIQ